jgi:hypothetical protein
MKKIVAVLAALAFVAVTAPAFAEEKVPPAPTAQPAVAPAAAEMKAEEKKAAEKKAAAQKAEEKKVEQAKQLQ